MAECFIYGQSGDTTQSNSLKVIGNYPLTENLADTMGNMPDFVSNITDVSISEQGVYLYDNQLNLSNYAEFLKEGLLILRMDIAFASLGTTKNKYFRRIAFIGSYGISVPYNDSNTTNAIGMEVLGGLQGIKQSYYTYSGVSSTDYSIYYPLEIQIDFNNKTMRYLINNNDGGFTFFNDISIATLILGSNPYGLNGYIRNLQILTNK